MIKDILVNLSIGCTRDSSADYAVSVARSFRAHITGVAFDYAPPTTYDPIVASSITIRGRIPNNMLERQRIESERAAKAATAKFEKVARESNVSADWRTPTASFG